MILGRHSTRSELGVCFPFLSKREKDSERKRNGVDSRTDRKKRVEGTILMQREKMVIFDFSLMQLPIPKKMI